jgi:hypothetical protein
MTFDAMQIGGRPYDCQARDDPRDGGDPAHESRLPVRRVPHRERGEGTWQLGCRLVSTPARLDRLGSNRAGGFGIKVGAKEPFSLVT